VRLPFQHLAASELWSQGWQVVGVDAFTERVVGRKVAVSIKRDRPDGVVVINLPIKRRCEWQWRAGWSWEGWIADDTAVVAKQRTRISGIFVCSQATSRRIPGASFLILNSQSGIAFHLLFSSKIVKRFF
jgi:hypothetical protein